MRRVLVVGAMFLALAATMATLSPPAGGIAGFGDVSSSRYFTKPVQWMVDNDITTGTSQNCFSPNASVTRGQAAAFLWRMEGSPLGAPPHNFADVAEIWQQVPVSWMAAEGITTGTSPTTYSPDDPLTRGQMAALIHRAAGGPDASPTTFVDVTKPWQLIPVGWMESEDITTGTSPTAFSPAALVTRGQFATFAYRWKGSPPATIDPASPPCPITTTTTTSPTSTVPAVVRPEDLIAVDWWGCWWAPDAENAAGSTPNDRTVVDRLPNCASGPNSVGQSGDMSHGSAPPIFRSGGANGYPSIEFTFADNTLLQTDGGSPWTGSRVLDGTGQGVTLAWIGMTTDVDSHNVKYLVTGLNSGSEYPQLLIEGEGPNRFLGYGGGNTEARSGIATVSDNTFHGVILYLSPNGSASIVEVDDTDVNTGQDSTMGADVTGLTLGNIYSRGFSTTDHQFVFLGLLEGQMSQGDKNDFWEYLSDLRG